MSIKSVLITRFDPIYYLILHTSLVLTSLYVAPNNIDLGQLLELTVYQVSFLGGIVAAWKLLGTRYYVEKVPVLRGNRNSPVTLPSGRFEFWFIIIVGLGFFLFKYLVFGFPLFSSDPEFAKLTFTRDGLGIVSRIESVFQIFAPVVTFLLFRMRRSFRLEFCFASVLMFVCVLSGGKSILVSYLVVFLVFVSYWRIQFRTEIKVRLAYLLLFAGLALCFALFVLALGSNDVVQSLIVLMDRITNAPGLGLAVYLQNRQYFDATVSGGIPEFIWGHLIVPMLAPFRIIEYDGTLARELGRFITGGNDFGPNPTLYLEGLFYFGNIGGIFYCFGLGILVSILRHTAIKLLAKNSIMSLLSFTAICVSITIVSTDFLVFIASLLNSFVFLALLFVLRQVLYKGSSGQRTIKFRGFV